MKNLLILALAFFSLSVGAAPLQEQGKLQGQAQGQGQAQLQLQSANADSRARAQAYAGALSRSEANNSISVTPAPVTLTVNEAQPLPVTRQEIHQDAINVRSVPNVFGGNVYPTAPCMGSSTVGAAALGWGASIGSSWADDECGIRETSRSFQNLGMTSDAVAVICSSKYAAVAPACRQQAQPR